MNIDNLFAGLLLFEFVWSFFRLIFRPRGPGRIPRARRRHVVRPAADRA